ncbi:MAG TPA: ATP-binding protein, partial [Puia sp.]
MISDVPVNNLFSFLKEFYTDEEHVTFVFSDDDNLVVRTDEQFLKTIMQNLTANAINALQKTQDAKIIWKAWKEKTRVCLSITDNGPGATSEQLKA